MPRITDLPKTYELSEENIKKLEKDWEQVCKEEDERRRLKKSEEEREAAATERFETSDKNCVLCKVSLLKYWIKEHEHFTPHTRTGQRLRSWWNFQGEHCPDCGLRYEFAKPENI